MKQNMFFVALAVFVLLLATLACGSSPSKPAAISDAVTAKGLDEKSRAVEETSTYLPEDTLHISVHVENLVAGSAVKVQYKYNGEKYHESILVAERAGSGYYGFNLVPHKYGHMPGKHTVEVYLNDALAKTISFTIEGESETEILSVVLARSLANDSTPINPTHVFLPTQIVHTSVEIKNMKTGSKVRILYLYPDEHTTEENMTIKQTGSGYIGFTLRPPQSGFSPGEYTVQVFLDGELSRETSTFIVSP